ncbi:hypothetical protein [Bradyrhizobium neotropicale]|uniref:hypothetical protein n=1 Tax=Bradyrhizobium neotropicale TaxID=1497615 RepID=UPI001AD742E8|nr:hypothetical protein [Bradyrhizobium neotropicale]MBO4221990.1 hypothetical protein [Bradyrhizobium neotropicale]
MIDIELVDVPPRWDGGHVGRRLCEAMQTLRMLPMASVAGYRGGWPAYAYEFDDLLAQAAQGELEKTMAAQNRTKLLPSYRDVTRMEAAICWPAQFLSGLHHLVRAVNCVALAHALEQDAGWVARKHGGYAETWRANHDKGCDLIATALRRACTPVF